MTKIDEYTSCQVKQSLPYTVNIRNSVSWTNCVEQKRKRYNEKMIFQDVNLKIYSKNMSETTTSQSSYKNSEYNRGEKFV